MVAPDMVIKLQKILFERLKPLLFILAELLFYKYLFKICDFFHKQTVPSSEHRTSHGTCRLHLGRILLYHWPYSTGCVLGGHQSLNGQLIHVGDIRRT